MLQHANLELPANINWFHSIDVGNGVITPGFKSHEMCNAEAGTIFSYPVKGKTVLDIGAWDGFFSFEAERRGASRVLATDHFCWSGPGWGNQDGFKWVREATGSKVEDLDIDPMQITPEAVGEFDVVLLSGVIYHVRDPLSVIERAARVTKECLIIESWLMPTDDPDPTMLFVNGMEFNKDPTNFYLPNRAAVVAMMKYCGFKNVLTADYPINGMPPENRRGYFFGTR
jgi:tRNA (mo5U34)-methyltransferase